MKNKFFVVLLTAVAIGILIVLSYRENSIKTYPSYKTSSMRSFQLAHKEGDKVKWELVSENATFPKGNKEVILKELTMKIHDEHDITLTGGSGIYYIEDRNLSIHKPIEIDIEGDKVNTDSLLWHGKERLITTQDMITYRGENFFIEGRGLTAQAEDQKLRIHENVKGIFYR